MEKTTKGLFQQVNEINKFTPDPASPEVREAMGEIIGLDGPIPRQEEIDEMFGVPGYRKRTSPERITSLKENEVFVFGSNEAGRHGAGAAKQALKWGASYGLGAGISGQTYAIPTKDYNIKTLSLTMIDMGIESFMSFAKDHPEKTFLVTEIGCGLAGYTPEEIAPMFEDAIELDNVHLPERFWEVLKKPVGSNG
jgi:hypothetical protein